MSELNDFIKDCKPEIEIKLGQDSLFDIHITIIKTAHDSICGCHKPVDFIEVREYKGGVKYGDLDRELLLAVNEIRKKYKVAEDSILKELGI